VTVDGVVQPAPAPRFGDGEPGAAIGALPAGQIAPAGAHTRAVLTGLGFADADELIAAGAAHQA
jgi:crotonobetainyl-CoA:carnitine CoA-transferase CaiB-like acyl-CoA transferase